MNPKHYKVVISEFIECALEEQSQYIKKQSSSEIAEKWLNEISIAIHSLSEFPERFPLAPEKALNTKTEVRHFFFKRSFRIVFTIEKNLVKILKIQHSARFRNLH